VADTGEVVGTYRMLPPHRAALAGRLYSDGEFDLSGLAPLRPALVETGRSCVHPDHHATGVWARVGSSHLAPPAWRVTPRRPWPLDASAGPAAGPAPVPPLLRGYLRLGAWVCGPPAHDPDFGVADLFVLLALDRVDPRYLRHFLGQMGLGQTGLGQTGLGQVGLGQVGPGEP
jgi:putative hemolysin